MYVLLEWIQYIVCDEVNCIKFSGQKFCVLWNCNLSENFSRHAHPTLINWTNSHGHLAYLSNQKPTDIVRRSRKHKIWQDFKHNKFQVQPIYSK